MSTALAEPAVETPAPEPTKVHRPFEPPPVRPGEIVWWSQSPVEDGGEGVAMVTHVGLRAVSVFVFSKGQGMPFPRDGVFHRDDPRAKHLDVNYSSGVWWKMPVETGPIMEVAAFAGLIDVLGRQLNTATEFIEKHGSQIVELGRRLVALEHPVGTDDVPKKQTVRPATPS